MKSAKDGLQSKCRECDAVINARWRASNQSLRRAYHAKPCFVEKRKAYKKANPGVMSLADARRRERVSQGPLGFAEKSAIRAIYQRRDDLNEWTGLRFEVDHILPLAKGGLHHPNNLQLLKAAENRRKGASRLLPAGGVISATR